MLVEVKTRNVIEERKESRVVVYACDNPGTWEAGQEDVCSSPDWGIYSKTLSF